MPYGLDVSARHAGNDAIPPIGSRPGGDLAEDYCILAMLGDEKADFDELYDHLLRPESAAPLQRLIGTRGSSPPTQSTERRIVVTDTHGWTRDQMARAAQELEDGYVNLGIGIPTLVAKYSRWHAGHAAVGTMLGIGPFHEEEDGLINAGKQTISELDHSAYFDSATSFR